MLNNGQATSCRAAEYPPLSSRVGVCGNGVCEIGEDAETCAADCESAVPAGMTTTAEPEPEPATANDTSMCLNSTVTHTILGDPSNSRPLYFGKPSPFE